MAFGALPREIRDIVLEKLLLEDTRMHPYAYPPPCPPEYAKRLEIYKAPDLAIMLVNKQVNAEATRVLYCGATFVISSNVALADFFDYDKFTLSGRSFLLNFLVGSTLNPIS